ncbi:hypothetical protein BASA60_000929 [Batrachochytrium salamandrivorans]|nr:hypothetical protein BASA60_000929 [Batrachochytrium salamandrivorans]
MDNVNIFVWKFQLRDEPITQWFEVRVDLSTGDIVSMDDFKRDFTYTAIELPNKSPYNGFSEIVDPENLQSSLYGWSNGDKTVGNNVLAKVKRGRSFKTTTLGMFSGGFNPMSPPQTLKNTEMGVVNAFYVANTFHDVFYAYGFNEPAGNFQQNNFKRGGKEGDPIIINIQDSKKKNGAYFYTPPDGQSGVLDLHIFTNTEPNRDSALDNTVMIHELAHGLSTRLTGGAHENMCMMKTESLGLMYWDFVDEYGFSANLHDATQNEGNIMFLQILVGTLMIQPCNPTFDSASDAMLATDYAYYGGINKKLITKGFSKRGLGSIS